MTTELTRRPVTATIHPDLLKKLMTALHPNQFDGNSTLYHMGFEQAKTDFRNILLYHLNDPGSQ